jgi:hypothetical protein
LARRRVSSVRAPRRPALGAEAPLRHHARVPADARLTSARHDAPHGDRAGELRL